MSRIDDDLAAILEFAQVDVQIAGRYVVAGRGRRGGESVVFKVRKGHPFTKFYALKVIPVHDDGANERNKVLQQIKIWENFTEGNVNVLNVNDLDLNTIGDVEVVCFQMEYSDYGSLDDFMGRREYEELDAVGFLTLAHGLVNGFMASVIRHQDPGETGDTVYHSDIKPQNVIIFKNGDGFISKVIDFGISIAGHEAGKGLSPSYAAPERILNPSRPPTIRSELWSIGITLYELLFARLPLDETATTVASYTSGLAGTHIDYLRPRFTKLRKGTLEEYVRMLQRLIVVKEADRPSSVKSVMDTLVRLLNDESIVRSEETTHSYLGKGAFIWEPELHKHYGETEYLLLFRSRGAPKVAAAEVQTFLAERKLRSFSMHTVFGPYDHIIRVWTKSTLQELGQRFENHSAHTVASILKLDSSRPMKGRYRTVDANGFPEDLRRIIRDALTATDSKMLSKHRLILAPFDAPKSGIRVFTFVEVNSKDNSKVPALFKTLFAWCSENTQFSKLIQSGRIYMVDEGTGNESQTRLVLEYRVNRFDAISPVISAIIDQCMTVDFNCEFKTFLEVAPVSVRLDDDGEFLAEIMRDG